MSRSTILQAIEAALENQIRELNDALETQRSSSDLNDGDTRDPEDFSQQTESRDMQLIMQQQVDSVHSQLAQLQLLAAKSSDVAEPGSIVVTDKNIFFLGLSIPLIHYDGKDLMGLSPESPAFASIRGKGKGDVVQLGSHESKIQEIL
jgi:hypothetical protein